MAIELRPAHWPGAAPEDLDEVFASGASVHLEVLNDDTIMLIIDDDEQRHVHLKISRSPLRVWVYEEFEELPETLPMERV